jgi:hypothetical protein
VAGGTESEGSVSNLKITIPEDARNALKQEIESAIGIRWDLFDAAFDRAIDRALAAAVVEDDPSDVMHRIRMLEVETTRLSDENLKLQLQIQELKKI